MPTTPFAIAVGLGSGAASVQALAQLADGERAAALLTRYRVVPDITCTRQSSTDLKLDLYLPPGEPAGPPAHVVMVIHGWGWIAGTKEASQVEVLPYLEMGWTAVNVEYRLARTALPPVITVHGDSDTPQAERLHVALGRAGVPNRLFTIPGGGHGGFTAEQVVAAYAAIKEFLAAHVK